MAKTAKNKSISGFLKGLFKSAEFPFIALFVLSAIMHIAIKPNYGDDPSLAAQPLGEIMSWLGWRFMNHSSRVIIDFFMLIAAHLPVVLWKITDVALHTLLAKGISELFEAKGDRRMNWFIVGTVLLYPFRDMSTAGWIATTANYLWPLTAGVFAAIPLRQMLKGQKTSLPRMIVSALLMLYATNIELLCGAMFGVYLILGIYAAVKRKINWYFFLQFAIVSAMLAVHLLCPGNSDRSAAEVGRWFNDYANLTLAQKVELGFSSTMFEYIMKPNYIFMLLCLLVLINTVTRKKGAVLTAIASVPVMITAVFGFGFFDGVFTRVLVKASDAKWAAVIMGARDALTNTGTNISASRIESVIPDAVMLTALVCLIIGIFSLAEKKDAWTVLTVLAAGFASRFVMAFSPTIWASMERTFIFFYAAMIYACTALFRDIQQGREKLSLAAVSPFMIVCAISYLSQLLYTVVDSMN